MGSVTQLEREGVGALTITPLQPTIGAEIGGIDLRNPLSDELRDQIKAALLKYKVIFFRDQNIDRRQHLAFAKRFGPIYTPPYAADRLIDVDGESGVHYIGGEREQPKSFEADRRQGYIYDGYHSDTNWRLVPSWGAILKAVNLPPLGGDTIWVNAGQAYRELPEEVKQRLEGLHAVVDFSSALKKTGHGDYPLVAHPIVRTHRETGEKILWVDFGKHARIIGVSEAENLELLQLILDRYRKPEYQIRFNWKPGSIAFWDNRGAVHRAVRDYDDFPRLLERVLIDDEPLWRNL
jgi:alpha-ketoglutarate-dependent sulfate ester dioxygenase